mgnify:CR=1 FL=1
MANKKTKRISFRVEDFISQNLSALSDTMGVSSAELNRMIMDEFLRNPEFQEKVLSRIRFAGAIQTHLEIE